MFELIERERQRLYRLAKKWGINHKRTLQQSKRVDRLIYFFMKHAKEK